MALVSVGFEMEVALVDNGANITKKTFQLQSADAAAAATDAGIILAALNNVTNCKVKDYRIAQVFGEDALVLPIDDGVQIEDQMLVTVGIVGNPLKSATLTIPSPKIGLFTETSGPGANIADPGDAALQAYIGLFSTSAQAFISDGELARQTGWKGRRIHRKSRRG